MSKGKLTVRSVARNITLLANNLHQGIEYDNFEDKIKAINETANLKDEEVRNIIRQIRDEIYSKKIKSDDSRLTENVPIYFISEIFANYLEKGLR